MNATVDTFDPWTGVLEHLQEATSLTRESNEWARSRLARFLYETTGPDYRWQVSAVLRAAIEPPDCPKPQGLTLVERSDDRDIIVSWQDPTRGRCGDQRWRRGIATVSGVCAMSGRQIKRGDYVFRPLRHTSRLPNLGNMILAAAVDDVCEYKPEAKTALLKACGEVFDPHGALAQPIEDRASRGIRDRMKHVGVRSCDSRHRGENMVTMWLPI